MKAIYAVLLGSTILVSADAFADQIRDGTYYQVSSNAGECRKCEIQVTRQTDHIIQISSNNGWIAYATYNYRDDIYRGMLEWKSGNGGQRTEPYSIELMRDGRRNLKMTATSRSGNFNVTYERD